MRRGGRAVEGSGLENRQAFARLEGSNPSLSATIRQEPGPGRGGCPEALAAKPPFPRARSPGSSRARGRYIAEFVSVFLPLVRYGNLCGRAERWLSG